MFGFQMSKIIDGLYVGGWNSCSDEKHLEKENITHLVSAHNIGKSPCEKHKIIREEFHISIEDCDSANIAQYFQESNDFIHKARLNGGNVLVFCQMGISRSVSLTCAYLMAVTNLGLVDVLKGVSAKRQWACPNNGFYKQLEAYEQKSLKFERERLRNKFEDNGKNQFDKDTNQLKENLTKTTI